MGFGGMAAVLVAMVAALTVLPALLAVLGPRVDALRIPFLRRRTPVAPPAAEAPHGAWYRLARSVMRRPVAYVAVIVPLLLVARRCRSCGWSSAASTTGCCRRAPRAGSSPRRC